MGTRRITHGLIIDTPWIDYIRAGKKTWEMRSTVCIKRGPIALIQKGCKQVVAIADLVDSEGPLSVDILRDTFEYHRVPEARFSKNDYKWLYAWKLTSVISLDTPIPYIHKNGSVIWAELDEHARHQLSELMNQPASCATSDNSPKRPSPVAEEGETLLVPMARDGSVFCPEICSRNGVYTVGNKGNERRFTSFSEALAFLRSMPTAHWRRPNNNGNWGIVSAVEWTD